MVYPKVKNKVTIPPGTPSGTLFVCVDETYGKQLCDPLTNKHVSLEDCARGYWTEQNLSASHGFACEWLMARLHGIIVGVWKIDKYYGWLEAELTPKSTWPSDNKFDEQRRGCILIPVDKEDWNKFVGKEVHLGRAHNSLRGYFI